MNTVKKQVSRELFLILIPIGIGINLGIGSVVKVLNLPFYLDAIGTILITILLGWRAGTITGVLSFVFMTVLGVGPFHIYFSLTQVAIALSTHLFLEVGLLKRWWTVPVAGVLIGCIAAIVSAPVIVYLFGGVEGNGPGLITVFLMSTGRTIYESVVLKGLSIEPLDKTIQLLVAFFVIAFLSPRLRMHFGGLDKVYKLGERGN